MRLLKHRDVFNSSHGRLLVRVEKVTVVRRPLQASVCGGRLHVWFLSNARVQTDLPWLIPFRDILRVECFRFLRRTKMFTTRVGCCLMERL